jgi:hypothetical protein
MAAHDWTDGVRMNKISPPPLLTPVLKERKGSLCSYLNVHLLRVYFLCHHTVSFFKNSCVAMNILNKGAAPHCDVQLNTLLLLVEIQCSFGSRGDSNYVRPICAPCCSWVHCTDGQTDQRLYTLGASAGIHTSLKMDFFYCLLGQNNCFLTYFLVSLIIIDMHDPEPLQNCL